MIAANKACLSCNGHLRGRADKKFCNDHCRNTYNNQLNSDSNKQVRTINHSLRKNRRILESLLHPGRQIIKTSRQQLYAKGFSFLYFTHAHTNKKGSLYHFCYEYGYRVVDADKAIIVKKEYITQKI